MADRPPYQPWYEGDFWSLRVRGQHWLVRLMYRAMLQGAWDLDPPGIIPNDDAVLRALAGNPPDEVWTEHKAALLNMFDLSKDEKFFTNQRQMSELKKYKLASKKRKLRARLGGKAKAAKHLELVKNPASSRNKQSKNLLKSANQNHNQNHNQNQVDKTICPESSSGLQVVLYLPLNSGEEFGISPEDFAKWKKLYPAVDVMQELRAMVGWLDANPTRRKTRTGVKAFINRWLARAQDQPKLAASFRSAMPPQSRPSPRAPDAGKELEKQLAETKPN